MIVYFIIYSFIGWLYESTVCSIPKYKTVINRGFLYGPYLPIYGIGAVINILILQNIENVFAIFTIAVLASTILEYVTAFVLENLFKQRWWDYSQFPFNVHGRICFYASFVFGGAVTLLIKVVHPLVSYYIMLCNHDMIFMASSSIVIGIGIDILFSIMSLDFHRQEIMLKISHVNRKTKDLIIAKFVA
jgi:uncharacterized membrane protein